VDLGDRTGQGGVIPQIMYNAGLPWVDHVLAQTNYQLEGCRRLGLCASQVSSLVQMGPRNWRQAKVVPPRVLWVGSHAARKRPELVPQLAHLLPEVMFDMVAVPDREGDEIEFARATSGIPNLTYHGRIPYEQVGRLFLRSSLLVNTSRLEGFPNVFLQAWANGTPVASLSTNPDGILEREGIGFCTNGSLPELARTISALLSGEGQLASMGRRAYRYAAGLHGIEHAGPSYETLFRQLTRKRRSQ